MAENDGEKWSRFFFFEIPRAPSEIPANQSGQFSPSGQIFLHWAAATLLAVLSFVFSVVGYEKRLQFTYFQTFATKLYPAVMSSRISKQIFGE